MMPVELWLLALVAGVSSPACLYYAGLLFSRGFHRGKQEFITELVSEKDRVNARQCTRTP